MLRKRSRPVCDTGGSCGICAGVMPQPSGSSGRYQPAPCCAPYASLSTYGGVTPAGSAQPVYGTCTNMFTPTASARPTVPAHCSYERTGKKSDPSAVTRVPSVPKRGDADAGAVVSVPSTGPARYVYVVPGERSVSVTECVVEAAASGAL